MKNIQKMIMWMLLAASLMVSGCASSSSGILISDKAEVPAEKRVISSSSGIEYTEKEIDACLAEMDFEPIDKENPFAVYYIDSGEKREADIFVYSRYGECRAAKISLEEGESWTFKVSFPRKDLPKILEIFSPGFTETLMDYLQKEDFPADDLLKFELIEYMENSR